MVYLDMKQFLMPILDKEDPNNILLQQDNMPSLFHKQVASFRRNRLAGTSLSLGHLIHLTLFPMIFPLGVHATNGYHLAKLDGRIRHALATVTLYLLNNMWTETEHRYHLPGHS
jgi:hypothetical protein